MLDKLDFAGNY